MKCALLVAAAMLLQEPAKPPMSWNLKKGEKVRYEFTHKIVKGHRDKTDEMELMLRIAIEGGTAKADGAMPATLTFEKITYAQSRHGESESYDSARDKEPSKGSYPQVLSKIVGKSIAVQLTPSGKFTAQAELQKLIQSAVDALPELKGRSRWNAKRVAQDSKRFEWLLRAGFETPKGAAAAIGDAWETKYDDRSVTDGIGLAVCAARLKEIRAGDAVVDQTIRFEFLPGAAALVREASGKGSFSWDLAGGHLKTLGATAKIVTARGDAAYSVTIALLPEDSK